MDGDERKPVAAVHPVAREVDPERRLRQLRGHLLRRQRHLPRLVRVAVQAQVLLVCSSPLNTNQSHRGSPGTRKGDREGRRRSATHLDRTARRRPRPLRTKRGSNRVRLGFELSSGLLGFRVAEGGESKSLTVSEGAEDGGAAGAVVLEDVLGGAGRVDDVAAAGGGVPHGGRAGGVEDCGRVLAPLVISGELVGEVAWRWRFAKKNRGNGLLLLGAGLRGRGRGRDGQIGMRWDDGPVHMTTGIRNCNQIRPNSRPCLVPHQNSIFFKIFCHIEFLYTYIKYR